MIARFILMMSVLALVGGCGGDTVGFGEECSTQDDCDSGLECVTSQTGDAENCEPVKSICTKNCSADSECTSYGAAVTCEDSRQERRPAIQPPAAGKTSTSDFGAATCFGFSNGRSRISQTLSRAARSPLIISSLWNGDGVIRNLSVPRGTVG